MSNFPTIKAANTADTAMLELQSNSANKVKMLAGQAVTSDKGSAKAVNGFEALLLHEMLKSMWETVGHDGIMEDNSNQAGIYRDMLNQAISDESSKGRGIGVKQLVQKEIRKHHPASK